MTDKIVVHTNNNYIVQIGESIHETEKHINCYQIVNRQYGVIEAETTMLISAIDTANDLDERLEELNQSPDVDTEPTLQ